MNNSNDGYKWLIAGSMLGMMGVYMGQSVMHNSRKNGRKATKRMTGMASRMTRNAGELLGAVGETLVNRVK